MAEAAHDQDSAAAASGAIYTCPMHPEIRQEGPGDCPMCGMGLEPLIVTAKPIANPERAGFTLRFWMLRRGVPTPAC